MLVCAGGTAGSWVLLLTAGREGSPQPLSLHPALPQTRGVLWSLPTLFSFTGCLVQMPSKPSSGSSGSAKLGEKEKFSQLSQENPKFVCSNLTEKWDYQRNLKQLHLPLDSNKIMAK